MHLRAALEEAGIDAGPENGAAAMPSREARKRAAFDSALDFAMILRIQTASLPTGIRVQNRC
ncbi:Sensory box sensor histidine kinase/response regulator [Pseudomonas savastanoi]|uniref:Sensory box sensor histidine kinase/response regulator n=1 Tax=Pseudomonas savastanoi TaxID=29438 RepID=A0A3M6AJ63_PSESS|nr:Sensory box sensor histidine kinase/response regulator [Pseudomonas syringae pv. cunninghamiae]RMV18888.1 Sensory box sensor histidine kinase/response regulator [Pseudomonas savastanoi]